MLFASYSEQAAGFSNNREPERIGDSGDPPNDADALACGCSLAGHVANSDMVYAMCEM